MRPLLGILQFEFGLDSIADMEEVTWCVGCGWLPQKTKDLHRVRLRSAPSKLFLVETHARRIEAFRTRTIPQVIDD